MKAQTLSIHWHDNNQPIYSVHLQPNTSSSHRKLQRLATGGGDNNVRVWEVVPGSAERPTSVRYLSTLTKHTQSVNVVRFDPKGELLATAGDDGIVLVWQKSDTLVKDINSNVEDVESWIVKYSCRSSSTEIYDLAWSPDSKYLLAGSMDNVTRIYNVLTGQCVKQLAEHNHYVQGVCWDPLNEYLATQSADRSVNIYSVNSSGDAGAFSISPTIFYKISRAEIPEAPSTPKKSKMVISATPSPSAAVSDATNAVPSTAVSSTASEDGMNPPAQVPAKRRLSTSSTGSYKRSVSPSPPVALPAIRSLEVQTPLRSTFLYHNETLQTFFRRLTFSPDGSLLVTPSGIYKSRVSELGNTIYVYSRQSLNSSPVYHLPGLKKPAVAISFSPKKYELVKSVKSLLSLPYRMIFAVATQDSVVLYDTQQTQPLAVVSNLHYSVLTDMTWSGDGKLLIVSSADGFCSVIEVGDLGEVKSEKDARSDKEVKEVRPEKQSEGAENAKVGAAATSEGAKDQAAEPPSEGVPKKRKTE